MEIISKPRIVLNSREKEILESAQEILLGFENNSTGEQETQLQDMYENYTEYNHTNALQVAIDLLGLIVEDSVEEY